MNVRNNYAEKRSRQNDNNNNTLKYTDSSFL